MSLSWTVQTEIQWQDSIASTAGCKRTHCPLQHYGFKSGCRPSTFGLLLYHWMFPRRWSYLVVDLAIWSRSIANWTVWGRFNRPRSRINFEAQLKSLKCSENKWDIFNICKFYDTWANSICSHISCDRIENKTKVTKWTLTWDCFVNWFSLVTYKNATEKVEK